MRLLIAFVAVLAISAGSARAADAPAAMPQMTGWFERTVQQLEAEAASDISMAPDVWSALARDWRSFDRDGSASWVLVDLAWVAAATIVALVIERLAVYVASRRPRRRMLTRDEGPRLADMLGLVAADLVGLVAFYAVFTALQRLFLPGVGITEVLALFAANVLIRWRVVAVVNRAIFRPNDPLLRLIDIPDAEAHRLSRFLSAAIFTIIVLVAFARYALADEDSGAPHIIGLLNAVLICALYVVIVFRTRAAAAALIRGRRSGGVIAAIRAGVARAWLPLALCLIAGLFVIFVAGLSLGLLSYYRAVHATLTTLFVLLVFDRLIERVWDDSAPIAIGTPDGIARLQSRTRHRIVRAVALVISAMVLVWTWAEAVGMTDADVGAVMRSSGAAIATLFFAFIAWELVRLAIDRHLHTATGVMLPGADSEDETGAPASRLETILPLMRAAFGVTITILAVLIVLSRLGVDTAPLIAGAGVFGLAVSFGSQSLVRDIISGLFYMWDDAFRVGEYIDTGRLKGTVETLGVRSVKLRHQNGPLHTIPYGQLGAVTNLSRDFATIKFNLRLAPSTDIELVRKTTKQIGLAMQDENEEMAAEVMLPLKLQGIAEVVDNALVLRFKFTSRPVKPSWVQREYLKRMYKVFAEKNITFASGAVFLQTIPPVDAGQPQPPPAEATGAAVATAATAALGVAAALEMAELAEPVRSDA